ncbi:MAG: 3-oxoacyl-ACP reductase FabG [Clostridia bacterium]|nr:3-oxoacyl-ACP reductase FabG [Clostridia bacterium]
MSKKILVTGGSKGIGKNIVEGLAKQGNTVILNYNSSEKEALFIQKNLREKGYDIEIYKADIRKRDEVDAMVSFVVNKYKKIDVLINNAGISQIKLFSELTQDEWYNMINTNLTGTFNVTQEVLKKSMLEKKEGCIINISSIWGKVGASCEVHYSASKAGVDGMTKALAKELGLSNIRVNSIAPGFIQTEMNKDFSCEDIKNIVKEIPLNKVGYPQNITKCVQWLIGDEYTTGQIISVDGGWSI